MNSKICVNTESRCWSELYVHCRARRLFWWSLLGPRAPTTNLSQIILILGNTINSQKSKFKVHLSLFKLRTSFRKGNSLRLILFPPHSFPCFFNPRQLNLRDSLHQLRERKLPIRDVCRCRVVSYKIMGSPICFNKLYFLISDFLIACESRIISLEIFGFHFYLRKSYIHIIRLK